MKHSFSTEQSVPSPRHPARLSGTFFIALVYVSLIATVECFATPAPQESGRPAEVDRATQAEGSAERTAQAEGSPDRHDQTLQAEPPLEPSAENSARPETAGAPSDQQINAQQIGAVDAGTRTELNLLGQTDTASGESRRNENVQINLIDNNVLKELNQRIGTTATIVKDFQIDQGYFGTEFGGSAA